MTKSRINQIAMGISLASLIVLMAGCGHNIATYVDGQEFSVAGLLVYRNGKILQSNIKENAELTLDANAKNSSTQDAQSSTDSAVKFKLKTGEQITGYRVELEEVKQEKNNEQH